MELFHSYLVQMPLLGLFAVMVISIALLGMSADKAISYAVELAKATGLSNVVIGATIVSLGTTFPEAVVSVMAAIKGDSGLALGNAVGSIICDTGLIMGIACILGSVPVDRYTVRRKALIQLAVVLLLVVLALPLGNMSGAIVGWRGTIAQGEGFVLVFLLVTYFAYSLYVHNKERQQLPDSITRRTTITVKLLIALAIVFVSSDLLVEASSEFARRLAVPEAIIAATIVALGTSLPELMTAVSAIRRGFGDLALGNVLGADILNVLFVAGVAASVTGGGLEVSHHFFVRLFPTMLLVVFILQGGLHLAYVRGQDVSKWIGVLLLASYLVFVATFFA